MITSRLSFPNVESYNLGLLSKEESIDLLKKSANLTNVAGNEKKSFEEVLRKCGRLAIAVTIIGKMRKHVCDSWDVILRLFKKFKQLEVPAKNMNLFDCLHTSIETLMEPEKELSEPL